MIWQDLTITIVNIVFSVALIPQAYYGFKHKKGVIAYSASVPTFVGLGVVCYIYLSLHLFVSAAMCLINGIIWFTFFVQRFVYEKNK